MANILIDKIKITGQRLLSTKKIILLGNFTLQACYREMGSSCPSRYCSGHSQVYAHSTCTYIKVFQKTQGNKKNYPNLPRWNLAYIKQGSQIFCPRLSVEGWTSCCKMFTLGLCFFSPEKNRVQQQGFRRQGGELAPHRLLSWLQENTIGKDFKKIPTSLPPALRGEEGNRTCPGRNLKQDCGGGDFFLNYYSPAQGLQTPAASLRVEGQQNLAPELLETMQRKTGLGNTLKKLILTSTSLLLASMEE